MAASHDAAWQTATVVENTPVTSAVHRIVLSPDTPAIVHLGSHVDVGLTLDRLAVTRSYSLVDAAPDGSWFTISVYESPASRGGAALMHALRRGDRLQVTQPLQDFPLRVGAPSYVLLAGGIGITAILGMADRLARLGADYRLVYCGRRRDQMAYLDRILASHGSRLELHIGDEGTALRVPALVAGVDPAAELYMCGPIRLMDEVRRNWVERELSLPNLRFETFGNSGWYDPEPFVVRIPALGIETAVTSSSTLLEALESAGVDALFDCRKGECGLCEARVVELSGSIDHRDVFYSERQRDAASKICVCVSRVRSVEGPAVIELELS